MRGFYLFSLTSFQSQTDRLFDALRYAAHPQASLILRSRIDSAWGAVVDYISLALRSFLVCPPISCRPRFGRRHSFLICSLRSAHFADHISANKTLFYSSDPRVFNFRDSSKPLQSDQRNVKILRLEVGTEE